jgi:hypothetical protein
LIVIAIFVGLGILGVGAVGFTVWRVAHAIHTSARAWRCVDGHARRHDHRELHEHYSASDLGTDIYPGAQPGKGSMRMTLPTGSVITAIYTTSDSKEQVVNYYKPGWGAKPRYSTTRTALFSPCRRARRKPSW